MPFMFTNRAASTLASGITSGATSLTVASGEGAKFPSPTTPQTACITLSKSTGEYEIVKLTARAGDVFTVVRAQEGTTAIAFSAADKVELNLTASGLDSKANLAEQYTRSGLNTTATASGIVIGQEYLITDENRLAVGLSATTYQDFAKASEGRRVVIIADATSITVNADTTDVASQTNTQVTGTLTVNAPTGSVYDGQIFQLRLRSTNVQTFSWNAIFLGTLDLALLSTSSGSSKWDTLLFEYNSTLVKWVFLARNLGA